MKKLFLLSLTLLMVGMPLVAAAQAPTFGNFEAPLPSLPASIDALVGPGRTPIITYLGVVINFVIGGIVAIGLITIVVAGYLYVTAGGDGQRVTTAKNFIGAAILGIILALGSYLLLNTINPALTSFVEPQTPPLASPTVNPPTPPQPIVRCLFAGGASDASCPVTISSVTGRVENYNCAVHGEQCLMQPGVIIGCFCGPQPTTSPAP